jgi:hypothetical protein
LYVWREAFRRPRRELETKIEPDGKTFSRQAETVLES